MKQTYVGPSGSKYATIAGVGAQPGIQEVRDGKTYTGPAGQGLDECFAMTKISRLGTYLTNVIKDLDQPLSKYIDLNSKGQYSIYKNGYTYIKELGEELKALPNLNVIVAFGNIPLIALCNRVGITKWRGSVIESTLVPGVKVIPTFCPSTFIPPKFNFLNKPLIVDDLLLAKKESQFKEIKQITRNIKIRPSFQECVDYLNYIYEIGLRGKTIDADIEVKTTKVVNKKAKDGELDCISFSWDPKHAISIPFCDSKGDYFAIDQEYELMLLIARIFQDERVSMGGANFIFDCQFLYHKYGIIPRGEIHCTQIAQKIMLPDFNAGLDFVTTTHTDIPYYKQDGKQWMQRGSGSWDMWWNYNGMDSIATSASRPEQLAILEKQGNIETYNRQRKLIKPLIYMAERGIKVDVEGMMKYKDIEQAKLDILIENLHREVGYEINPNSPKQLREYFYRELNIKPYKKRNTKGEYKATTDVDAMKRISRRGYKAAQIMLDIRSLSKRISTYLNVGKVDKDGRYRSSYKPVGAETGRLSSGETIFGTGGNQQNWPHDLLRFFIFDEGYLGYSIDLSQIENRIVAYVGGVIPQIEAFEQGIDLHRMTASIIFGKPYNEISGEDGSSVLGDGRQSERYWGKKGNHAVNYDVTYKTFALKNEMPEKEAKYILEHRIHKGYPQIRGGYHLTIQDMLKKDRTVTNLMGRSRLFLGPIIPQYPNVPKSACINTYREAYAQLPQSTTADKINEHGLEYIYYDQEQFAPVELLAQVHDSVVFQIPLSEPWEEHARMVNSIKQSLEQPLYWKQTKIETPADVAIGLNMCKDDMTEIKSKDIPSDLDKLANIIKETHEKLKKKRGDQCYV